MNIVWRMTFHARLPRVAVGHEVAERDLKLVPAGVGRGGWTGGALVEACEAGAEFVDERLLAASVAGAGDP